MNIPHTYRKSSGTYYARFALPRRFYPNRDIRLSLSTKSPTEAKQRVYSLANHWHVLTCSNDFNSYNNPQQIKSELLIMWEREEEERKQRDKRVKTTKKRVKHNPFKPPLAQPVDFSKIINKIEAPDGTVFDTGCPDKDFELLEKYQKIKIKNNNKNTNAVTGLTFKAIASKFIEEKSSNGDWETGKTKQQQTSRINKLCALAPNKPVNAYTRDNARQFRKNVLNIVYRGTKIELTTAEKYFNLVLAVIDFGNAEQLINTAVFNGLTIKGETKPKGVLTDHHLSAIFNGYIYKSITPPSHTEPKTIQTYMFWLPLICTYTGLRISEVSQLKVQDINQCPISNVYYFKIMDDNSRKLKTKNSHREIPIHNAILNAGFLSFYNQRKKLGITAMLFTGVTQNKTNGYGTNTGGWFNGKNTWEGYLAHVLNGKPKGWGTHMFRHTITDYMRNKLGYTNEGEIATILGHGSTTVTAGYGGKTLLHNKAIMLNKVVFNVNLNHLSWDKFEQYMNDFNNK